MHEGSLEKTSDREEKGIEGRKIKHPEIEGLRRPIEELLLQLRQQIEGGEYRLIVGDDASGRIPTLLFDKVVGAIYKEKGYPPPKTIFFAGGYSRMGNEKMAEKRRGVGRQIERTSREQGMNTMLENLARLVSGKPQVLVVTEAVQSGEHLSSICDGLKDHGLKFDIATVGLEGGTMEFDRIQRKLGGSLYFGMRGTPGIYFAKYLSGVTKRKKPEGVFAQPFRGSDISPEWKTAMREVREHDVPILSADLIRWWKEQEKERQGRAA